MNDTTKMSILEICQKRDELFVLDAYNYIFRFYFAHKDLSVTTEDGHHFLTGHIFGFTKHLLWLKSKFPNSSIVVCVDGNDQSRKDLCPEYKAHREHEIEPADDIPVLKSLTSLIDGVYWCYDENFEADDAAASVVRTVKYLCNKFNIDKQVYLLSSDKDWWQLIDDGVNNHCKVSTVKKWGVGDKWFDGAQIITEDKVSEEFNGIKPENLLKFRAITGDSSDNLKGYYRFYKKNAAIIAENFDYNKEEKKLILKDGSEMRSSWDKFLSVVTNDMSVFSRNYDVMTLKEFDFELEPIFKNLTEDYIERTVQALSTLKLYYYMSNVNKFSPYGDIIKRFVDQDAAMAEDTKIETIETDLETLL